MTCAVIIRLAVVVLFVMVCGRAVAQDAVAPDDEELLVCKKDTGYRGIWYYNQETHDEYVYKYSGGLGTYCADHIPFAIYAPEVHKTFFVYGGTKPTECALMAMVSYYDHRTGTVPRPTILVDKGTFDAHDNPVISIDGEGYIWIFISAHGKSRPAHIVKSTKPYDIDSFEHVLTANYSYPQPWYIEGEGFLFLHTSYDGGRKLYAQTSADGITWTERAFLAGIDEGHYQVSWAQGKRVGTAFNYHPKALNGNAERHGLNWRTNLYYIETDDMGRTWHTADGKPAPIPLETAHNSALVYDYEAEDTLVYINDINFDKQGRPAILYVTGKSWEPGPRYGEREWKVAHWMGDAWAIHHVTTSDSNYDCGSLYIEPDNTWRIIGPTQTGPQPYNPGGEVAVWTSRDQGQTWSKRTQATTGSVFNHSYCRRPVNAHPGFYAFWADGHGRRPSESRLYFSDKTGRHVYRLPYTMDTDMAKPERVSRRPGAKSPENVW